MQSPESKASDSRQPEPRQIWTRRQHREAGGPARSTLYDMPVEMRPRSVFIGSRLYFIESPADWAKRVGLAHQPKLVERAKKNGLIRRNVEASAA